MRCISYIKSLSRDLRAAIYGYNIKSKVSLLFFRAILRPVLGKGSWLRKIADLMCRGSIIQVYGVRYVLADMDSAGVVLPDYEKQMWRYLKPKEGDVFIDVGAHVGKYALRVAKIVGEQGLVIAIEPHPDNYRALIQGIQLNNLKNVIPLNIAAYDKECELKLYIAPVATMHTVTHNLGRGYIKVRARPLDDVLRDIGIRRVDWVKIDVEGAELKVLRGLRATLKEQHPRLIIETWPENRSQILDFMKKYNYKAHVMEGLGVKHLEYIYFT